MQILITLVTFVLFFIEAMFHYNIGQNGALHKDGKQENRLVPKIHVPPLRDLWQIVFVLTIFSVLNGFVITLLRDRLP